MTTHTFKITDALLVAQREIILGIIAKETKYIVMFREQNAGENHKINFGDRFFKCISKLNIRKQAYV